MNLATLYKEASRVIDLMDGLPNWYRAIRSNGIPLMNVPRWNLPSDSYTFAIGVRDGMPVFEGDVMYGIYSGMEYIMRENNIDMPTLLQWDKPEINMIAVNGMKYKVPSQYKIEQGKFTLHFDGFTYYFGDQKARDDVVRLFNVILDGSISQ